ncbi:sugar transferase [Acidimangrovimonas pyrenivorans]|uniref:Sugar transferase n=1 Tax=Acidimangrovimonas pyrenivorans TaxID=2030798 RepID=A0ABV7AGG4_9RHOB
MVPGFSNEFQDRNSSVGFAINFAMRRPDQNLGGQTPVRPTPGVRNSATETEGHSPAGPFSAGADQPVCAPDGLCWAIKQAAERCLAGLLILFFAPVLVVIALAIVAESGRPVFFVQPRFGRNGTPISILKFRTMRQELSDISGANQTADEDPRITCVGQLLRRTSLDELPQLWNVLTGQMALIGPRAHPCGMRVQGTLCEDLDPQYHLRHVVRPGITGWAQVSGSRGAVKTPEMLHHRVALDLEYIRDWSLWRDLKIALRTVQVVLSRRQAR